MPTHGVLFDLGFGLFDEWPRILAALRWLSDYLNRHGLKTTPQQLVTLYTRACRAPQPGVGSLMVQTALAAGADPQLAKQQRQHMPWDAVPMNPLPGALDALKLLRNANLRLGVLANQPASAAKDLQRSGLTQYLDDIWLSEAVMLSKPDPRFFQLALNAWQLPPNRVAYLGDRPDNDIAPPKRLGLHTVRLILGPHADQPATSPDQHPDYQTPDLLDAAQHLLHWASPPNEPRS